MKHQFKNVKPLLIIGMLVLIMTSCAESISIEACVNTEPDGFLNGLWHGVIAPITFIISLFKEEVAMYAIHNNGAWYNFGFLIGASITLGGSSKASCKNRKK